MSRKKKNEQVSVDFPVKMSVDFIAEKTPGLDFLESNDFEMDSHDMLNESHVEENKSPSRDEIDLLANLSAEELPETLSEGSVFLSDEIETEGFIPEVSEDALEGAEDLSTDHHATVSENLVEGTELDHFESANIEDLEFVEDEQVQSIIESILFASDRPVSLASIQQLFKGTTVKKDKIRRTIEALAVDYAGGRRGVVLEEITGGYQLRTKIDNMNFLKRTVKTRAFKLSGPALETLSIIAYKQPVVKVEVDQIRGVESGHLLRALMEKGLVNFESKAESLPGKPMQYGTTRRFLEIFGLRNLKELPTLSQIDELLPEGIGDEPEERQTLSMVSDSLADHTKTTSYSQGEEELGLIEDQLIAISTSSEFFEQEKLRQKMKRDEEKAQNIREALTVGEEVPKRDINWLKKYDEQLLQAQVQTSAGAEVDVTEGEKGLMQAQVEFNDSNDSNDSGDSDNEDEELAMYEEADDDGRSEEHI